jgi:hypothetical protein
MTPGAGRATASSRTTSRPEKTPRGAAAGLVGTQSATLGNARNVISGLAFPERFKTGRVARRQSPHARAFGGRPEPPFQRSLRSLPPLLGLRPAAKGKYPLPRHAERRRSGACEGGGCRGQAMAGPDRGPTKPGGRRGVLKDLVSGCGAYVRSEDEGGRTAFDQSSQERILTLRGGVKSRDLECRASPRPRTLGDNAATGPVPGLGSLGLPGGFLFWLPGMNIKR